MHDYIRAILLSGCSIEIGKLSICDLNNHYKSYLKKHYQVHCDHHKERMTEVYSDIDTAIDKFILLKKKCYK